MTADQQVSVYQFQGCCFDASDGRLTGPLGQATQLRPKVSALFRTLLEHPNEVVSKEALIETVWGDGVVDYEAGLSALLKTLRTALTDVGLTIDPSQLIETLPKRGVRLNASVTSAPCMAPLQSNEMKQDSFVGQRPTRQSDKRWLGLVVSMVMVLMVAGIVLSRDWSGDPTGQAPDDVALLPQPASMTLAILPLAVYEAEPQRAKAQGLLAADALLSALWSLSLPDMALLGRASLMPYQGLSDAERLGRLASDLGVSHLIEGHLLWVGSELSLSARLVEMPSYEVIWSETVSIDSEGIGEGGAIERGAQGLAASLAEAWPLN